MQRAGIDDAHAADAQVLAHVRVALKEIIVLLLGKQSPLERWIVAMNQGDFPPVQLQLAKCAKAVDVDRFRVALKSQSIPIAIAPDESRLQPRQVIEHGRRSD